MSDLDVRKVCDQLEGLAVSINRHGDSDVLVAAADLLRSLEESASQVVGLSADVTRLRAALIESMNEGGTIADKLGAAEAQVAELRSALEAIAAQQPKTLQTLRSNGVVFDGPLGADPKNWQHVAFSIYTDLCEVDTIADNALADLSHSESPLPQAAEVRVKELEQQGSGQERAALDAAGLFLRIFDSVAQDENDGTYRLHTDADLFNAAGELRAELAALAIPLPASSVVPVEAGTGEAESAESADVREEGNR